MKTMFVGEPKLPRELLKTFPRPEDLTRSWLQDLRQKAQMEKVWQQEATTEDVEMEPATNRIHERLRQMGVTVLRDELHHCSAF